MTYRLTTAPPTLDVDVLLALRHLLATPDGEDLRGRGHRVTYPGHPHRRHLTLKPLLVRWMVCRHLAVDAAESSAQPGVARPTLREARRRA